MAFNLKNIFIYKDKILTIVFFIAVFIYLLSPIMDLDFPWHLKSGEYIVQHKTIPEDDPFSHTHEGFIGDREKFQLSQYWLAQVIFYTLYSTGGFPAIVIFRTLLFLFFLVLLWVILRGRGLYFAFILITLSAVALAPYTGDNPQIFSTLFVLLLIFFFEGFRKNPSSPNVLYFIPLLMLLWANLHGGFIFGIALIIVYVSTEAMKYLFCRKGVFRFGQALNTKQFSLFFLFSIAAIFISYLNPNGFKALVIAFEPYLKPAEFKAFYKGVRGYMDPVQATADPFGAIYAIVFWILLGYTGIVALLKIVRTRAIDLTSTALITFSIAASLSAVRYIPFFIGVAIPLMVNYHFFKEHVSFKKLNSSKLVFSMFMLIFLFIIGWQINMKENLFILQESRMYPVRAANFLSENRIEGNMYNSYNKGGYLLWRLYPQYKVFFDTRVLNMDVIGDGIIINNALNYKEEQGLSALTQALSSIVPDEIGRIEITVEENERDFKGYPMWKEVLDRYKINIIVHEACEFVKGDIYPLVLKLMKDDEWSLIYLDGNVLIFLRNKPDYERIIRKFKKHKELVFTEIILESSTLVRLRSPYSAPYSSLALALTAQGRTEEARKMVEAALTLDKKNIIANFTSSYITLKEKKMEKERLKQ